MNNTSSKYAEIVRKLFERTSSGTLDWVLKWDDSRVPETRLGGFNVRISEVENAEGEPLIKIGIYDDQDDYIDGFSDEDIINVPTDNPKFPGHYSLMDSLYRMAWRDAKGADKAVEAILNDLDEGEST